MKTKTLIMIGLVLLLAPGLCHAQAPYRIAGFELGSSLSDVSDRVRQYTALPIRHMEYLEEVEIKKMAGFKSGLLGYGTCKRPGQILRIKLKYEDSRKEFFSKLLDRFEKRFGKPVEWRGDPFHVVLAWKWSFVDENENRISLILQHNTMDSDQKMGNAVKLTMTNLVGEEQSCFEKKHPEYHGDPQERLGRGKTWDQKDWEQFTPY